MKCDVVVIGGGVIGLACAWRLAQGGAQVALFERGAVGREASWAAAGMLAAQTEAVGHPPATHDVEAKVATFELCLQSRELYAAFADELGEDVDFRMSSRRRPYGDPQSYGVLYLAGADDAPIAQLKAQAAAGLAVEEIPLAQLESEFGDVVRGQIIEGRALWLPEEGSVDNRRLATALHHSVVRAGVEVHEHTPVQGVEVSGGRVTKIRTANGEFACGNVLLCAGAWSGQIAGLPPQCVPPVRPVLGQMLLLRGNVRRSVFSPQVYLVPRSPGFVVVGSTMEERGFDKTVTASGLTSLLDAAGAVVPALKNAVVEEFWAGLRPASPDGLPILGRTALDNFYVATAHFRKGILLTPITAQLMADCILNDKEPPREFRIARFYAS